MSAIPGIEGIDHIHVYVSDRMRAERWYADVLGYSRIRALAAWATPEGPLTLSNTEGNVHLALFERPRDVGDSSIAFGATGGEFLRWLTHLRGKGVEVTVKDHELAVSMYFEDEDANLLEITTYEHRKVRADLPNPA